ncbi:hypothetical protein WA026_023747 [Henosepilachna vigintioctopunctata]|uniref:Uncharacterized protein n=1 Tax=Henosepilachna vigintioctopunctata TaxID=420089 RepID=A0AAW1UDJ9_9CUCU
MYGEEIASHIRVAISVQILIKLNETKIVAIFSENKIFMSTQYKSTYFDKIRDQSHPGILLVGHGVFSLKSGHVAVLSNLNVEKIQAMFLVITMKLSTTRNMLTKAIYPEY